MTRPVARSPSQRRASPRAGSDEPARPTPAPPRPAALTDPGFLLAALVTVATLIVTVSFRLFDYDLWEHLVVGKYLWTAHRIPATQLWTWPTYGEPAMIPSWGFRAALWPFWQWGGVPGLFLWRWLTALVTFGLLFLAARRMRAAPIVTLVVVALAALVYRGRTMVRPETLALALFAAEIAILESRRAGGPLRAPALVAIAWVWVNVHLSFYMGLLYLGIHAAGEAWPALRAGASGGEGRPHGRRAAALAAVGLAALAISFVNPFGGKAVIQPWVFAFGGRAEPIYRTVTELGGIDWSLNWRNGLPLLMAGWPLLLAWRARRRGLDLVETLTCVAFSLQALLSQRLKAAYAVAAVPYVARDLGEWLGALRRPPLALPAAARGALAAAAIVALGAMEWTIPQFPLGLAIDWRYFPVAACDFIERAGVRGRAFNHFWYGGYMEWRFWPERDRLPFMDGHLESGTERDRTLYTYAQSDADAWRTLDRERRFDFVLLSLKIPVGVPLRGSLDADTSWAEVFADDAAVVFVRRSGPLADVARRYAYRRLRVGAAALEELMTRCASDSTLRAETRDELERQVRESPYTAVARSLLAELALMDGRPDDARRQLEAALRADPDDAAARARLRGLGGSP